jgi:hypothetical protein
VATGDELTEARTALAHGQLGYAIRKAWEAAFASEYVREPEQLAEIQALASQLEELTTGAEQEEAHRLVVYCAACREDIDAGIPHDSALGRLFRRA